MGPIPTTQGLPEDTIKNSQRIGEEILWKACCRYSQKNYFAQIHQEQFRQKPQQTKEANEPYFDCCTRCNPRGFGIPRRDCRKEVPC